MTNIMLILVCGLVVLSKICGGRYVYESLSDTEEAYTTLSEYSFTTADEGLSVEGTCQYNGMTYNFDDIVSQDLCSKCVCQSPGLISCMSEKCSRPRCAREHRRIAQGECCPTCPVFSLNISCELARCEQPKCVDWIHIPNHCCPICPDGENCQHDNLQIKAGRRQRVGTQTCYCADEWQEEAVCTEK